MYTQHGRDKRAADDKGSAQYASWHGYSVCCADPYQSYHFGVRTDSETSGFACTEEK